MTLTSTGMTSTSMFATKIEHFSHQDKVDYSNFKHGSKSVARKYGRKLARSFINSEEFDAIMATGKSIVIASAPYNNIPTASFTLKDYFMSYLADYLIDTDVEVEEVHIYRKHSYTTEYGEMSVAERKKAISADSFQIDGKFVSGKHVIFVDDCRITGAHEDRIKSMVKRKRLNISASYIYYAAISSYDVDPKIEDHLNHYKVKGIDDILELIMYDQHTWNTRVIKKILRSSTTDLAKFVATLMTKSSDLAFTTIHTITTYAILNGYHKDDTMTYNIKHLMALHRNNEVSII